LLPPSRHRSSRVGQTSALEIVDKKAFAAAALRVLFAPGPRYRTAIYLGLITGLTVHPRMPTSKSLDILVTQKRAGGQQVDSEHRQRRQQRQPRQLQRKCGSHQAYQRKSHG
jgi:hypothetical protein